MDICDPRNLLGTTVPCVLRKQWRCGCDSSLAAQSSLGSMHESFAQFLQLELMGPYGGHARLDEELLFVLFGGRRALIKG